MRRAAPTSVGAGSLTARTGVAQGNSEGSAGWPPRFSGSAVCVYLRVTWGSWFPRISRSEIRRISNITMFLSAGWLPGAVYDPGIFVTDSPALSRAASESRSRTAAWARGRCQGGAGRGRRQVLRKLSAAGRQRARPAAWHGGRRVTRSDVRARGCCVCPCQPGLPVSVAAHSAATAMRAQRVRFLPLPPPSLGTGGSRIAPPLCPLRAVLRRSFSVDDVERMVGPRGHVVPPVRNRQK